jgi:four helix bundle protein
LSFFIYAKEIVLKNFRAYQLAVDFYRLCEKTRGSRHLHDQLLRASSSIVLNLAEGSERGTDPDQRRFYRMAMGSIRECQAILDIIALPESTQDQRKRADILAASLFKLLKSIDSKINRSGERRTVNSGPKN